MTNAQKLDLINAKIARIKENRPDLHEISPFYDSTEETVAQYFAATEWYDKIHREDLECLHRASDFVKGLISLENAFTIEVY